MSQELPILGVGFYDILGCVYPNPYHMVLVLLISFLPSYSDPVEDIFSLLSS